MTATARALEDLRAALAAMQRAALSRDPLEVEIALDGLAHASAALRHASSDPVEDVAAAKRADAVATRVAMASAHACVEACQGSPS